MANSTHNNSDKKTNKTVVGRFRKNKNNPLDSLQSKVLSENLEKPSPLSSNPISSEGDDSSLSKIDTKSLFAPANKGNQLSEQENITLNNLNLRTDDPTSSDQQNLNSVPYPQSGVDQNDKFTSDFDMGNNSQPNELSELSNFSAKDLNPQIDNLSVFNDIFKDILTNTPERPRGRVNSNGLSVVEDKDPVDLSTVFNRPVSKTVEYKAKEHDVYQRSPWAPKEQITPRKKPNISQDDIQRRAREVWGDRHEQSDPASASAHYLNQDPYSNHTVNVPNQRAMDFNQNQNQSKPLPSNPRPKEDLIYPGTYDLKRHAENIKKSSINNHNATEELMPLKNAKAPSTIINGYAFDSKSMNQNELNTNLQNASREGIRQDYINRKNAMRNGTDQFIQNKFKKLNEEQQNSRSNANTNIIASPQYKQQQAEQNQAREYRSTTSEQDLLFTNQGLMAHANMTQDQVRDSISQSLGQRPDQASLDFDKQPNLNYDVRANSSYQSEAPNLRNTTSTNTNSNLASSNKGEVNTIISKGQPIAKKPNVEAEDIQARFKDLKNISDNSAIIGTIPKRKNKFTGNLPSTITINNKAQSSNVSDKRNTNSYDLSDYKSHHTATIMSNSKGRIQVDDLGKIVNQDNQGKTLDISAEPNFNNFNFNKATQQSENTSIINRSQPKNKAETQIRSEYTLTTKSNDIPSVDLTQLGLNDPMMATYDMTGDLDLDLAPKADQSKSKELESKKDPKLSAQQLSEEIASLKSSLSDSDLFTKDKDTTDTQAKVVQKDNNSVYEHDPKLFESTASTTNSTSFNFSELEANKDKSVNKQETVKSSKNNDNKSLVDILNAPVTVNPKKKASTPQEAFNNLLEVAETVLADLQKNHSAKSKKAKSKNKESKINDEIDALLKKQDQEKALAQSSKPLEVDLTKDDSKSIYDEFASLTKLSSLDLSDEVSHAKLNQDEVTKLQEAPLPQSLVTGLTSISNDLDKAGSSDSFTSLDDIKLDLDQKIEPQSIAIEPSPINQEVPQFNLNQGTIPSISQNQNSLSTNANNPTLAPSVNIESAMPNLGTTQATTFAQPVQASVNVQAQPQNINQMPLQSQNQALNISNNQAQATPNYVASNAQMANGVNNPIANANVSGQTNGVSGGNPTYNESQVKYLTLLWSYLLQTKATNNTQGMMEVLKLLQNAGLDLNQISAFINQVSEAANSNNATNLMPNQTQAYQSQNTTMVNNQLASQNQAVNVSAQNNVNQAANPQLEQYLTCCHNYVEHTNYFFQRCISQDVIKRFKLGFDPNFNINGVFYNAPVAIIPISNQSFLARHTQMIDGNRMYHYGGQSCFNLACLDDPKNQLIFITSGEFDALSLETFGCRAIALGSNDNTQALLNYLQNAPKVPRIFFICLKHGGQWEPSRLLLNQGLKELHYAYSEPNLISPYSDINEALLKNRQSFLARLNQCVKMANYQLNVNERNNPQEMFDYFGQENIKDQSPNPHFDFNSRVNNNYQVPNAQVNPVQANEVKINPSFNLGSAYQNANMPNVQQNNGLISKLDDLLTLNITNHLYTISCNSLTLLRLILSKVAQYHRLPVVYIANGGQSNILVDIICNHINTTNTVVSQNKHEILENQLRFKILDLANNKDPAQFQQLLFNGIKWAQTQYQSRCILMVDACSYDLNFSANIATLLSNIAQNYNQPTVVWATESQKNIFESQSIQNIQISELSSGEILFNTCDRSLRSISFKSFI